jgi:competence protein ComEA
MSFYRTLLAALAAVVIASPVFAEDMATTDATAPAAEATQASTDAAAPAAMTDAKVNVNKASVKELVKVKGLNASKARAIVAYRKKNGDFKSVEDLAKVKGMKKMKAEDLKAIEDQLTVE